MNKDHSVQDIRLQAVSLTEQAAVFELYKTTLFEHIDAVFGWDDIFQQQRIQQQYEPSWLFWVHIPQRVALLCYKVVGNSLHVHLLLVFPAHQGQGLGAQIMLYLHEVARQKKLSHISLSSFKHNQGALRFYRRLGYVITHTEADFYTLVRPLSQKKEGL